MSLVQVLTCDCNPGFNWKSKATFNAHKRSQRHLNYENKRKDEKITATKMSNELDLMTRLVEKLTREKIELEKKVDYLETCLLNSSSVVCSPVSQQSSLGGLNATAQLIKKS